MKSWTPCNECVHRFIIVINQKGQESISLAKKEEGNIQVERGGPRKLVDAERLTVLALQFYLEQTLGLILVVLTEL